MKKFGLLTAIAVVAIPLSLIATFIGLYLMGYTLNLMSLLGLSLVVGILVDDAIVVIENIHRHMEMGKNKVRAAYDGAAEIGFNGFINPFSSKISVNIGANP